MYKTPKTSLILPLVLMFGPVLVLAVSFAIQSAMRSSGADAVVSAEDGLFGEPTAAYRAMTVLMMLSFVAWLPGFIAGLIILAKRLSARRKQKSIR